MSLTPTADSNPQHASEDWHKKFKKRLIEATELGDEKAVQHILSEGGNVDFGHNIFGPLHTASKIDHLPLVQMLLDAKANVDASFYGMRPIFFAKDRVLEHLLDNNATITLKDIRSRAEKGDVKSLNVMLSKRVIDLNAKYFGNRTLLHVLADSETEIPHFDRVLDLFVKHKIHLNVRDETGAAPLHYALLKHNDSVAVPLMERTDYWPKDRLGLTPPDWLLFDQNPMHIVEQRMTTAKIEVKHVIFKIKTQLFMTCLKVVVCFFRCKKICRVSETNRTP